MLKECNGIKGVWTVTSYLIIYPVDVFPSLKYSEFKKFFVICCQERVESADAKTD